MPLALILTFGYKALCLNIDQQKLKASINCAAINKNETFVMT
jgi:hypothetical protein